MKKDQKGRTMIEVIMVLGIVSVLAASTYGLVSNVWGKFRTSRVSQQLIDLQKVVAQRYAAIGSYKDADNNTLIDEKIVPKDMINGNNLQSRTGGEVIVSKALDGKAFSLTFKDLPKAACLEMLTINWVHSDSTDLYSIEAGGEEYKWPRINSTEAKTLPIDVSTAAELCQDETDVTWVFY